MVKELLKENKEDFKEEKDEEDEEEDKEVEKSVNTVLDQLQAIVDSQSVLIETQKAIGESLIELSNRVETIEKAGDVTPKTDLPLTPKVQDKEDVGAKVKIPSDVYQSESIQSGLKDDGAGHSKDQASVKIEKATPSFDFTTETPRPNAAYETVNKSYSQDYSPILKDARASGDLSQVARDILAGKYYVPSEYEVGF